ncbi:MAG: hypothetical protein E6I94_00615 [Chloroflexi bacterium]|nr:MAG: hypothetical protein E6I94_00615 [Chloroflexota bacterium]
MLARLSVALAAAAALVVATADVLPPADRPPANGLAVPTLTTAAEATPSASAIALASAIPPEPTPVASVNTPSSAPPPLPSPVTRPSAPFPARLTVSPGCDRGAAPHELTFHVPILMYHRILPAALARGALPGLAVSPTLFAAQLRAAHAAGWRTITLGSLAADIDAGRDPGPRTFVITIDDGHEDGYTNALPVLERFGDVATYFVVTGRLDRGDNLTSDQVRQLAADGMEIGDHTVSHVDLASLSIAAAQAQIEGAAVTIADLTGSRPTTFAYPFGDYDPAVVWLVHQDGFALAVTTHECAVETRASALLTPRVRVTPDVSPADLLAML